MTRDRLLIIDDDGGFRRYAGRVGESCGFETFTTGDAAEFRDQIRRWRPSVVMMDLNMPGADGIELLRDLVEAKSEARILIASGVDLKILETAERLAAERGLAIAGTLQKPVRAAKLKETLERLHEIEKPLMARALAHAIKNDELILEYQPKLNCGTGQVQGVEALVRWRHPSRGLIPPDQFIPLAEQNGLIHDLTEWVLNGATNQAALWRQQGTPLDISVNVSARDLEKIDLPDRMIASCEKAEVAPASVTLELTESAAMSKPAESLDVLTRLRLKGFRLSIDDFGTGYSSLVQLRRLPFSELKIDKSFVMQMAASQDCRIIVEAVAGIGQKLGLNVVAEGVETSQALGALRTLGVDIAQGYFISRPVAPDTIAGVVKVWSDDTLRPRDARGPAPARPVGCGARGETASVPH
jgi:EAL domain-containing protein (putative c-di-GMP-specific phosphodiesterase class I)/ActR/RegA family two-component response regulator